MSITTTLNRIRTHRPRERGWKKLLKGLGKTQADDEPLPFAKIVEINGLDDALWCCRAEPQYTREWRLFAVWCARRVQYLTDNPLTINAIDVAERHVSGKATDAELAAAWAAAGGTADEAAEAAAEAAVWAAASDAVSDGVCDAAWAAVEATAWDATWQALPRWEAEREAQKVEFLRIVNEKDVA